MQQTVPEGLFPGFTIAANFSRADPEAKRRKKRLLQKQPVLSLSLSFSLPLPFSLALSFSPSPSSFLSSSPSPSRSSSSSSCSSFTSSSLSLSFYFSLSLSLVLLLSLITLSVLKTEVEEVTQTACWTPFTTSIANTTNITSSSAKKALIKFNCRRLQSLLTCRVVFFWRTDRFFETQLLKRAQDLFEGGVQANQDGTLHDDGTSASWNFCWLRRFFAKFLTAASVCKCFAPSCSSRRCSTRRKRSWSGDAMHALRAIRRRSIRLGGSNFKLCSTACNTIAIIRVRKRSSFDAFGPFNEEIPAPSQKVDP